MFQVLCLLAPAPGSGGNADSGGLTPPLLMLVHHSTTAPLLVQVSVVFKWEASGWRCTCEGGPALPMQCTTTKVQRVLMNFKSNGC